jgi:hypothetical protein
MAPNRWVKQLGHVAISKEHPLSHDVIRKGYVPGYIVVSKEYGAWTDRDK